MSDVCLGLALSGDALFEQLAEDVSEAHDQPLLWAWRNVTGRHAKRGPGGGTGTPLESCVVRCDTIDP